MSKFSALSLERVESLYNNGQMSDSELIEYIREWNAGPHMTQAVYRDGKIRNYDPENHYFSQQDIDEFGVRI